MCSLGDKLKIVSAFNSGKSQSEIRMPCGIDQATLDKNIRVDGPLLKGKAQDFVPLEIQNFAASNG
ncbi:hypothetical protein PR048_008551 [Dryococelus australis]|uniref:Uncharacterized protein n=1 Tax=Dryococelus australis TaxID=614101 RepID=A0ABQ9HXR6_9NEOP|nr:hypothetical protein PR048_008551 [Dryococelus australis]